MLISRKSPLTGHNNSWDLLVTKEQMDLLQSRSRPMIQDIFPNLTAEQREFILTGYTPDDWKQMFPPEDG